ncbi:Galactoside 3(4)-L-fucosyltransferase, partial [Halocaridina rubra]
APPISTFGTEAWASAEEKGIFFNMTMSYHHLNDIITSDTALMPLEMPQDCPLLEGDRMDTNSLTYTYYKAHLRDYDTVVQKHERDINNWIFSFSKENISEINEKYDKQKDKLLLSLTREEITWATRRKLTVWMASNCQTDSKREKLVEVLQNYINVTTVGKCGTQKCGKNHHDTYCYRWLAGSHQFYLSFENAVCDDYYSEKLWRPMEYGMVPVVYGGAKYKDILPTGSYIDVHSFPSPGKLAEHLIYLSKNPVAYLRHLRWRRFWRVREPIPWYCKVCSALHRTNKKSRKVLLDEWWNKTAKCYQSIL